ncbi:MAG: primosomal protein N' [bacterium]
MITPSTICRVAVPSPLRRSFDYLIPDGFPLPKPGCRVQIPFGRQRLIGIVLALDSQSAIDISRLKPIISILDDQPLIPETLLSVFLWAADYYQHPVGDALAAMFPVLLREGKPIPAALQTGWRLTSLGLGLPENALSRAKKQQALLNLLQKNQAVTDSDLEQHAISRAVARELEKKALIEKIKLPVAPHSDQEPSDSATEVLKQPRLNASAEQQRAINSIPLDHYRCTLLDGATGSGKTEVYLQLIEAVVSEGRQALILVPEISLTPQTLSRFQARFNRTVVSIHSSMTNAQRLASWEAMRIGDASILVGTRSAIFTPVKNPGIIIVDEEHDGSFKQQDGFHYSARDLAVVRGHRENIPVVLGSATPSLESIDNCHKGRYQHQILKNRHGKATQPSWQLIDLNRAKLSAGFSTEAIEAIRQTLDEGNQALVFLNRRGFAPRMSCNQCGWAAECSHCDSPYTVHLQYRSLICHHCESRSAIPKNCPNCHSTDLTLAGQGTEKTEQVLQALFPEASIYRIDRDTTRRKHHMREVFEKVSSGEPAILVGTQMLAKGHHFPDVTLVILVDVDNGLFSPDFRAPEKTGQLIMQVAGRSGRSDKPGRVLIQSHCCDHPLLTTLCTGGYGVFSHQLLRERQAHQLPPAVYMAQIRAHGPDQSSVEKYLKSARQVAESQAPPTEQFRYLGPLPGAMEKKRGRYRFQLSLFSENRRSLHGALNEVAKWMDTNPAPRHIICSIDVDPTESA